MFCELRKFGDLSDAQIARWDEIRSSLGGYRSPFFSPGYTKTVSEVRRDVWVLIAGESDKIDLIWPLQISGKSGDPAGAPFCDYHGPIVHSDWQVDLRDIVRRSGLNTIRMTGVYDPQCRLHDFASEFDGAFIADISNGADAIFDFQQKEFPKHAKKMRRLARKVEREIGDLTFNFESKSVEDFEQLIAWKRQQYLSTGRHDVLGPEWSRKMIFRLWESDDPTCKGYLHTLKHGDRLIAAEFNLTCRSTIHGWIPAYDPEFAAFAPGYLIQHDILKEAYTRGFQMYDLGVSAGHYKKFYSSYQIPVLRATIRSSSPFSRFGQAGEAVWHGLEGSGIPKISHLAGQVRRRYEVIRSAETSLSGRVKGVVQAAKFAAGVGSPAQTPSLENREA